MSLSAAEKKTIETAANKASKFVTGHALDAADQERIVAEVESFQEHPKPKIGKEAIALWAAKVDYAIANGDRPAVKKLISLPADSKRIATGAVGASILKERQAQFYDSNGGCSCGGDDGGASGW